MEPEVRQRLCHVCGDIDFTLSEQFDNELTAKCKNCEATVKFYSQKDLMIEES